ncbi:MAG: DNA mismatch repair protein [Candidatus Pseudobacter hemicellulosilyticus]|uniref:DNA mismatch repair protein n=1 Tax=Candidatus Pseudobacter hemicellulosilyticus TaxID=3121375 RepID=A0AAJ6BHC0_9BACT|nr:MAG: DNA mismatch repair protein [Pseudobacter sp.]
MSFSADKQTLDDLNLLGRYKNNSVFSIFNKVRTDGGEKLLDYFFHHPLTDVTEINKRSELFRYFGEKALTFPLDREAFNTMENYLASGGGGNVLLASFDFVRKRAMHSMGLDKEFEVISKGLYATVEVLHQLNGFLTKLAKEGPDSPFQPQAKPVQEMLNGPRMQWLAAVQGKSSLPLAKLLQIDNTLRVTLREEMASLLQLVYHLDVYIAVSGVAKAKGFSYARALPASDYVIRIQDCKHPGLDKAVANSVSMDRHSNVVFLTGANMAGKSTFMKSFGISLVLAHMGFPVAASSMEFSVRDGIYTSINVPDNLQMGYSHFYAEVRRVKMVAEEVAAGKNLVVIFDELFKGTNVKDAYDATLAVTQAFSEYRNSFFIISTHIIEVADALKERCNNLQFLFLPTIMEGTVPKYTYRLQEGVTEDRHGMMIIENEGIVGIIKGARKVAVS